MRYFTHSFILVLFIVSLEASEKLFVACEGNFGASNGSISMIDNFGNAIKVDMDILISGAILIDVGKLLEYEIIEGKLTTSNYGKVVRHPFSGVAIAARFELPPEVQHIIGTHSKEGDLGKRTIESIIVHHADFVSFEPFKV